MGVDLAGHGLHYNWSAWGFLFETGQRFGWKPAGCVVTNMVEDGAGGMDAVAAPDEPRIGYDSNDYQQVTDEDAAQWAAALYRALEAFHALDGQAVLTEGEAEVAREFADAAARGGFLIG
jgi:hypothetical protein